jgi:hypothetical protein
VGVERARGSILSTQTDPPPPRRTCYRIAATAEIEWQRSAVRAVSVPSARPLRNRPPGPFQTDKLPCCPRSCGKLTYIRHGSHIHWAYPRPIVFSHDLPPALLLASPRSGFSPHRPHKLAATVGDDSRFASAPLTASTRPQLLHAIRIPSPIEQGSRQVAPPVQSSPGSRP